MKNNKMKTNTKDTIIIIATILLAVLDITVKQLKDTNSDK